MSNTSAITATSHPSTADHSGAPAPLRATLARKTDAQSSHISADMVATSVRVIEFLVLAISGLAIALSYVGTPAALFDIRYLVSFVTVAALTVISFELMGLYTSRAFGAFVKNLPRFVLGWTMALGVYAATVFFLKAGAEFSRAWLAMWFVIGTALVIAERAALSAIVKKWAQEGRLYRRAVLYGVSDVTQSVIDDIENDADCDVRIMAVFDDRGDARAAKSISHYPKLGGVSELETFCREHRIDLVIVSLPIACEARLGEVVDKISVLPADIKLPARTTSVRFSPRTYSHVGSVAMIDLYDKPIANWSTVSKWFFDKVIGITALVLLAPVMAGIAVAIKATSKGPVLFKQKRYGFNNELIEVYKFRSMFTDLCDADATKLVTKHDPRVTPIGRFIRKTSLDELPQLFNVVLGTLSLVGPRPHAVQAKAGNQLYDEAVKGYFARHKVKPGITGWAQVNGWRGETDTTDKIENRVAHDLYYIENWSLMLDLYILLKTPMSLLNSENAY